MPIPISVVVCTRNRSDSLRRCVEALSSIKTEYEWELVIVDNGSDDGTGSFLASLPTRYRNVQVTLEPKRGLGAARMRELARRTEALLRLPTMIATSPATTLTR
jgi:glucosyl-dolichyl phosphate glucuronosyltransferase